MICETSGYQTCEGPPTSIIGRLTLKKWVGYWNSWSISKSDLRGFPISEFPWISHSMVDVSDIFNGRVQCHSPRKGLQVSSMRTTHWVVRKYIYYMILYILLNSYIQQMYLSPLNLPSHFQYLSDLSVICCRYLSTIKHSNGTLPTYKGCSLYLYLISH